MKKYIESLYNNREKIKLNIQELMKSADGNFKKEQEIIKLNKKQRAMKFHLNTLYGSFVDKKIKLIGG